MHDHFEAFHKSRLPSKTEGNQGNLGNQTHKTQQKETLRKVPQMRGTAILAEEPGEPRRGTDEADREAQILERQAFAEIEGGVHPSFVAGFVRLQMNRPEGLSEADWHRAIHDAGRFLDTFGAKAAAFGWSPDDVFSGQGLAWALKGGTVTDISVSGATLSDGCTFDLFG